MKHLRCGNSSSAQYLNRLTRMTKSTYPAVGLEFAEFYMMHEAKIRNCSLLPTVPFLFKFPIHSGVKPFSLLSHDL